jgi:hypothetical protein
MTTREESITLSAILKPPGSRRYSSNQDEQQEWQKQGVRTKFDPRPSGHKDIIESRTYRFHFKTKMDPLRKGNIQRTDPVWFYAFITEGAGWGVWEVCEFLKKHNVGSYVPLAHDQNKPAVSFGEMVDEFYENDFKAFGKTKDRRWCYENTEILLDHIWLAGEIVVRLWEMGYLDSHEAEAEISARYTGSRKIVQRRSPPKPEEARKHEEEGDGDYKKLIGEDTEKEVLKKGREVNDSEEDKADRGKDRGTKASAKRPAALDTDEEDEEEENEAFLATNQETLEEKEKEATEMGSDEEENEEEERERSRWGTKEWKAANKTLRQKNRKNQEFTVGVLRDNRTLVKRLGGYVARDRRDANKDMQEMLEAHFGDFMKTTSNRLMTLSGTVNGIKRQLEEGVNCSRKLTEVAGNDTSNGINTGNEGQGLMRSQSCGGLRQHIGQTGGGPPEMGPAHLKSWMSDGNTPGKETGARVPQGEMACQGGQGVYRGAVGGQEGDMSTCKGHQPGWANQGEDRTCYGRSRYEHRDRTRDVNYPGGSQQAGPSSKEQRRA